MKVSVIVTTYNWPVALDLVLQSLHAQSHRPDQVIVADDGSGPETGELVAKWQLTWPAVEHVWHVDDGFRAGEIRNRAIEKARGEWLVMIDGDCVCPTSFIQAHLSLASPLALVAGNRLLLDAQQTSDALAGHSSKEALALAAQSARGHKLRRLALGPLRDLMPQSWKSVRTCNLGVARKLAVRVRGFDESYKGWGKEDSDFAVRCLHAGAKVRQARFACTVVHLHHTEASRDRLSRNQQKLDRVIAQRSVLPAESCLMDSIDES